MRAAQNAERQQPRTSASPSQLKSSSRHAECAPSSSAASPVDGGAVETFWGLTPPEVAGGELRSDSGPAASATLRMKASAEGLASGIAVALGPRCAPSRGHAKRVAQPRRC